jgi:hypothetical protein
LAGTTANRFAAANALDRYLQTQATQDIRRNIANCFVAVEIATGKGAGYYTLSAAVFRSLTCLPFVSAD